MKTFETKQRKADVRRWTGAGLAILTALGLGPVGLAGTVTINNFDGADEVGAWYWEDWSAAADIAEDPVQDAGGSGWVASMQVVNRFPEAPGGYQQAVVTRQLEVQADAEALYVAVALDIKVEPGSQLREGGADYGFFEVIFRNGADWTWNSLGSVALTSTEWTHLEFPVKAPGDAVHHLTFKLGGNGLSQTVTYNVDNIVWVERDVPVAPPTMAIARTTPGLQLLAAGAGQWDRQNIATAEAGFGWIGAAQPVLYSLTIKEFPDGSTYPGFGVHCYLVPGSPGTESAPDWTEPTCIIVDIQAGEDGSGTATFRYKTNAPDSNGINNQYYNSDPANGPVGELGSVTGASVLGRWQVSLSQDTHITLTAPDGTTTDLELPAADAAQFAGGNTIYFGCMPNREENIGQRAVLGAVEIRAGDTVLLADDFSTPPLDETKWVLRAASGAAGVSILTAEEPYLVSWTTPASGFELQVNSGLEPAGWTDPGVTAVTVGQRKVAPIPASALPSASAGFFRLVQP